MSVCFPLFFLFIYFLKTLIAEFIAKRKQYLELRSKSNQYVHRKGEKGLKAIKWKDYHIVERESKGMQEKEPEYWKFGGIQ